MIGIKRAWSLVKARLQEPPFIDMEEEARLEEPATQSTTAVTELPKSDEASQLKTESSMKDSAQTHEETEADLIEKLMNAGLSKEEAHHVVYGHPISESMSEKDNHTNKEESNKDNKEKLSTDNEEEISEIEEENVDPLKQLQIQHAQRMMDLEYERAQDEAAYDLHHRQRMLDLEYELERQKHMKKFMSDSDTQNKNISTKKDE
jgi:hypothetical protein